MKKSLSRQQIAGFLFTAILGSFLHFAYEISGENPIVASFSAVNESTWEHMKILFFPMFLFSLYQYRLLKDEYNNFWCVKLKGILTALILIPVLFYTYKGVLGFSLSWLNILIFYICAAIGYISETKHFKEERDNCISEKASFFLIILLATVFIVFTWFTPELGIFKDPVSGGYGI